MNSNSSRWPGRKEREIWATYIDETIRVYQAYNNEIADAALQSQKFVPPWKPTRMTWIKPSFTWMAYRSGWSLKDEGQSRILAVDLHRWAFDLLLSKAILARDQVKGEQVDAIVQWDPERDISNISSSDDGNNCDYTRRIPTVYSLQMGLRGEMAMSYATEFIASITDITNDFLAVRSKLGHEHGDIREAERMLPQERLYTTTAVCKVLF
jgi:hypothetical protein